MHLGKPKIIRPGCRDQPRPELRSRSAAATFSPNMPQWHGQYPVYPGVRAALPASGQYPAAAYPPNPVPASTYGPYHGHYLDRTLPGYHAANRGATHQAKVGCRHGKGACSWHFGWRELGSKCKLTIQLCFVPPLCTLYFYKQPMVVRNI